jgi:hypothetical protein
VSALAEAYRSHTIPEAVGFGLPVGALVNELGPDHDDARRRVGEIYENLVQRVAAWFADSDRRAAGLVIAALEGAALVALACRNAEAVDVCTEQLTAYVDAVEGAGAGADEMPPPSDADREIGDWKAW